MTWNSHGFGCSRSDEASCEEDALARMLDPMHGASNSGGHGGSSSKETEACSHSGEELACKLALNGRWLATSFN